MCAARVGWTGADPTLANDRTSTKPDRGYPENPLQLQGKSLAGISKMDVSPYIRSSLTGLTRLGAQFPDAPPLARCLVGPLARRSP